MIVTDAMVDAALKANRETEDDGRALIRAMLAAALAASPPVRIQTVDAAVLLHRFDRLAPEVIRQFDTSVHQSVARDALEAMRAALTLPPGSGGTGTHAARERAYTGQPRARWDPSQDPNTW